MSDTLATGGAPASPAPAPAPSPPASTAPPASGPRPSAPPNPRSTGYSPKRNQMEEAAGRAAGEAPGEAPPPPAGDQPQPAAQGAKFRLGEDLELTESEIRDMVTRRAADLVRKSAFDAALPTPDAYKAELPKDFKAPPGIDYKLDTADPMLAQFKQFAHKYRLPQEALAEGIGIYAGGMVGTDASIAAARAAEVAKLGSAGPARIDNLMRVMDGNGLGVVKSSLVTAKQVEALEAFFARLETQGVGSFSQRHRVSPADDTKIAGYDSMSFEQRRLAQDQIAARRGR